MHYEYLGISSLVHKMHFTFVPVLVLVSGGVAQHGGEPAAEDPQESEEVNSMMELAFGQLVSEIDRTPVEDIMTNTEAAYSVIVLRGHIE